MYKTNKKEEFSRAYICALAAPLGFNMGDFRVDDDSVDIIFKAKYGTISKIRNPHINFQLKCTKITFNSDNNLHYPLKIKNYNDLRGGRQAHPIYLVVLCIPKNEKDWVEVKSEEMLLRYSAYWISLKDAPAKNNKTSVTIKISKQQKLDKISFKILMDKASEGIAL
jgi:hypothetical protein